MQARGVVFSRWKRLYQAAILEADRSVLPLRIVAAEIAIRTRMDELNNNSEITDNELGLLASARTILACLRRGAEEGKAA